MASPTQNDPSTAATPPSELPVTLKTPTFAGFVTTQFLGAFNDNYFKQLVLLTCINQAAITRTDRQPLALAAFALPFVLLSGFGGFLSDRFSKQRTIVLCKVAEIAIMALALAVLLVPECPPSTQLLLLIGVLALMGGQSAIFGPSKYGALPELFRPEQLLLVNGVVQMTTFLAIIFGVVSAGIAMDVLNRELWPGSLIAVGIAVMGTLTSVLIRRTYAANPKLTLKAENLAVPGEVRNLLRQQPAIFHAILVATLFWFIGGVTQPAVNTLGRVTLGLSETRSSMLTAAIGIGIAAGCILVGSFGGKFGAKWVMRGAWGIIITLFAISLIASRVRPPETSVLPMPAAETATDISTHNSASSLESLPQGTGESAPLTGPNAARESLWQTITQASSVEWTLRSCMILLGGFAGAFVVPLQVYLQQTPPKEQKGRVLGVQNLCSWIGILASAVFLVIFDKTTAALFPVHEVPSRQHLIFTLVAVVMLPVAICYRLPANSQSTDRRSTDI